MWRYSVGTPDNPGVDIEPTCWVSVCGMATSLGTFTDNASPPHVQRIPNALEYLRLYALEVAYVDHPKQNETHRAFRH